MSNFNFIINRRKYDMYHWFLEDIEFYIYLYNNNLVQLPKIVECFCEEKNVVFNPDINLHWDSIFTILLKISDIKNNYQNSYASAIEKINILFSKIKFCIVNEPRFEKNDVVSFYDDDYTLNTGKITDIIDANHNLGFVYSIEKLDHNTSHISEYNIHNIPDSEKKIFNLGFMYS